MTEPIVARAVRRWMAAARVVDTLARTMASDDLSNCLLWAMRQRQLYGGALILVPSAYGPWDHVQWRAPDGAIWEFEPTEAKTVHPDGWVPTLFDGRPSRVPPQQEM